MLSDLKQLVNDVDGAWAAAIGGLDGLLVEGYSPTNTDLNLLVAEHAGLFRAVQSVYNETVNGGGTKEFYVRGDNLSVFLLPINEQFFLLLAMDGRSNLGQSRLYSRAAAARLVAEL